VGYRGLTRAKRACAPQGVQVRIARRRLCEAHRSRIVLMAQAIEMDQAIDRMPMRLIVRRERALGSCEFCTGLIQTDCSGIEFEAGFDAGIWFDFWAWVKVN